MLNDPLNRADPYGLAPTTNPQQNKFVPGGGGVSMPPPDTAPPAPSGFSITPPQVQAPIQIYVGMPTEGGPPKPEGGANRPTIHMADDPNANPPDPTPPEEPKKGDEEKKPDPTPPDEEPKKGDGDKTGNGDEGKKPPEGEQPKLTPREGAGLDRLLNQQDKNMQDYQRAERGRDRLQDFHNALWSAGHLKN